MAGENGARLFVRDWRKLRGISQVEASRRAHIRQHTWSDIELGVTKSPQRTTLLAIARALRVSVEKLYTRPEPAAT